MKKLIYFSILAIIVSMSTSLFAQNLEWQPTNGPWGGWIYAMAATDSACFASTANGLYYSTNNGTSWNLVDTTLSWTKNVVALGASGTTAFALSAGGTFDFPTDTVFRSTDFGKSWQALNLQLYYGNGFSPYLKIFTSLGKTIFALSGSVALRSTDNGDTWVLLNITDSLNGQEGVECIATSESLVFVTTISNGFYLSSDSGNTWANYNTLPNPEILWIAASGGTILASVPGDNIMYRSRDTGETWDTINGFVDITSMAFANGAFFVGASSSSYGTSNGLYRSLDSGNNWLQVDSSFYIHEIRAISQNRNTLFADAEQDGIYRSYDNGSSWDRADTGIGPVGGYCAANASGIYMTGIQGIWHTTNFGDSWIFCKSSGAFAPMLSPMAIASNTTMIFAGPDSSVFRSKDNGVSWSQNFLPSQCLPFLLTANDTFVYSLIESASSIELFQSKVNDTSWTMINTPGNLGFTLASNASSVFVGDVVRGMSSSLDAGNSWITTNDSSDYIFPIVTDGNNICAGINPRNSSGNTDSVLISLSTDDGSSWKIIYAEPSTGQAKSLAIHGNIICAGLADSVICSTNLGTSWSKISNTTGNVYIYEPYIFLNGVYRGVIPNFSAVQSVTRSQEYISIFPNPLSSVSKLEYTLDQPSDVTITILDPLGRIVSKSLTEEFQQAGQHEIPIDARGLAPGIYLCRLSGAGIVQETKFVVER